MSDFERLVKDSGIPTTQAELSQKWADEVTAAGSTIQNNSKYSPFWRVMTALVTKPVLWLIQLLIKNVMPQFFLKTATGSFLTLWGDSYGVLQKQEQVTRGLIRLNRIDTSNDLTIPAGQEIRTLPINGVIYRLNTLANTTFTVGQATVYAEAEAQAAGAAYNLEAGYYNQIDLGGVTATNEAGWITQLGADAEDPEEYRARIRNAFNTLASYHTDGVYKRLISEFAGIQVDGIWFEHGAPRGPGTANAYVLFDLAAPSDSVLTTINNSIMADGNHGHGDDLEVMAIPSLGYALVCDLYFFDSAIQADRTRVIAEAEQAIRAAFRENKAYSMTVAQPMSRFSMARLAAELIRLFPELSSVVFDQPDITSGLNVPALGSLTVQEGI